MPGELCSFSRIVAEALRQVGFDHGVIHPLQLLCDAKVLKCCKKAFKDFLDDEFILGGMAFWDRPVFGEPPECHVWQVLGRAEKGGFFCFPAYAGDPWLDGLRGEASFIDILNRAEQRTREAERRFVEHPASRILAVGLRG